MSVIFVERVSHAHHIWKYTREVIWGSNHLLVNFVTNDVQLSQISSHIYCTTILKLIRYIDQVDIKSNDIYRKHLLLLLLFYVHGKHLRSCRESQLTYPHFLPGQS